MIGFGDTGLRVAGLHRRLVARGVLHPERAAAEIAQLRFGPDTAQAVRTFQAQQALRIDGWVSEGTWATLCEDILPEASARPAPAFDPAGRLGAEVLRLAARDVGVREVEPGRRRGERIDEYLTSDPAAGLRHLHHRRLPDGTYQGAPYSALAAACWVREAAARLQMPCPLTGWDLSSAVRWAEAAQAQGRLSPHPWPGRIGLVGLEGCYLHVVVCASLDGDHLETLEADSAHQVLGRRRPLSHLVGYVALAELRPASAAERQTICLTCKVPLALCPHPEQCPHRQEKERVDDRPSEL